MFYRHFCYKITWLELSRLKTLGLKLNLRMKGLMRSTRERFLHHLCPSVPLQELYKKRSRRRAQFNLPQIGPTFVRNSESLNHLWPQFAQYLTHVSINRPRAVPRKSPGLILGWKTLWSLLLRSFNPKHFPEAEMAEFEYKLIGIAINKEIQIKE